MEAAQDMISPSQDQDAAAAATPRARAIAAGQRGPRPELTWTRREGADVSWQARAACGDMAAQLFFGPDGERPQERQIRKAKAAAVCALCPMRAQCLDYALRNSIKHGIWGGLNKEQRARERRRQAGRSRAA
jgi:WhiB family transcriptional regulator, redox-sensing transcriptional regulator